MPDPDHRPTLEFKSPETDDRVSWLGGICFRFGVSALLSIPLVKYLHQLELIGWKVQERITSIAATLGLLAYLLGMASIFVDRQIRFVTVIGMLTGLTAILLHFLGSA